jgi:hypothetical protein
MVERDQFFCLASEPHFAAWPIFFLRQGQGRNPESERDVGRGACSLTTGQLIQIILPTPEGVIPFLLSSNRLDSAHKRLNPGDCSRTNRAVAKWEIRSAIGL